MKHMNPKNIRGILKSRRGIVGLEAAIVLIAFVIIAAAFSFMVVNQGLFATERGKTVIQEGLKQASTPLTMDGSIFVRTTEEGNNVSVVVIPVRAFGVKYVAMWQNETVVTLKVGQKAWANVYGGVLYDSVNGGTFDPSGFKYDDFVNATYDGNDKRYENSTYASDKLPIKTVAVLAIENSNGDESLDAAEKGYLIILLNATDCARERTDIVVELRLEKTSPLSIEFTIPESMPKGTWMPVG